MLPGIYLCRISYVNALLLAKTPDQLDPGFIFMQLYAF